MWASSPKNLWVYLRKWRLAWQRDKNLIRLAAGYRKWSSRVGDLLRCNEETDAVDEQVALGFVSILNSPAVVTIRRFSASEQTSCGICKVLQV